MTLAARETGLKVTAYDVADLAGVSQSAVSRAYTEGASISPVKRRAVLDAAKVLGYRPNLLARSLTTRRSNIVGLAAGNLENPLFTTLLDALSVRLTEAGQRLLMFTARMNAQVDAEVEEVLSYRVDALVLLSTFMSPKLAAQCSKAGIRMINVNRAGDDLAGARGIAGDNVRGTEAIAAHLIAQGYRRLAYMAGVENSSVNVEREAAFGGYLARHGLPPPIRANGRFSRAGATEAMRRLLSRDGRPDAVFCASDHMAAAAIDVARSEFGLKPGFEIGIAGFNDVPVASWPAYSITTYSLPVDRLADEIVSLIMAPDDMPEGDRQIVVPGELIVRNSTLGFTGLPARDVSARRQ